VFCDPGHETYFAVARTNIRFVLATDVANATSVLNRAGREVQVEIEVVLALVMRSEPIRFRNVMGFRGLGSKERIV